MSDRQGFFQLIKEANFLPDITMHQWWIPETELPLCEFWELPENSAKQIKPKEMVKPVPWNSGDQPVLDTYTHTHIKLILGGK